MKNAQCRQRCAMRVMVCIAHTRMCGAHRVSRFYSIIYSNQSTANKFSQKIIFHFSRWSFDVLVFTVEFQWKRERFPAAATVPDGFGQHVPDAVAPVAVACIHTRIQLVRALSSIPADIQSSEWRKTPTEKVRLFITWNLRLIAGLVAFISRYLYRWRFVLCLIKCFTVELTGPNANPKRNSIRPTHNSKMGLRINISRMFLFPNTMVAG